MKFSQILKGRRARKTVTTELAGQQVTIDVRMLSPLEEEDILTKARQRAKDKGVDDPREGEPIYDLARAAFVVVATCVDPESPADAPQPFFASVDELMSTDNVTPDDILMLAGYWEQLKDECSTRKAFTSEADFIATVAKAAGGDLLPFLRKQPPTQSVYFARLAVQYASLLASKFGSTSPSSPSSDTPTATPSIDGPGTTAPPVESSAATPSEQP